MNSNPRKHQEVIQVNVIYENGSGEIEEKKSRFIANVYKVKTEDEAVGIINEVKKKYWDAKHNCYAYVIGEKGEIQRFSDDGEPQGTAGKPILEIITKGQIYNCLIVVTRYFGGTLLGTGGLIRAYQEACKAGLDGCVVLEVFDGVRAELTADYNSLGKIQYICVKMGINIIQMQYSENVYMEMVSEAEKYEQFIQKITDAFSGSISVVKIGQQKFGKNEECGIVLL